MSTHLADQDPTPSYLSAHTPSYLYLLSWSFKLMGFPRWCLMLWLCLTYKALLDFTTRHMCKERKVSKDEEWRWVSPFILWHIPLPGITLLFLIGWLPILIACSDWRLLPGQDWKWSHLNMSENGHKSHTIGAEKDHGDHNYWKWSLWTRTGYWKEEKW